MQCTSVHCCSRLSLVLPLLLLLPFPAFADVEFVRVTCIAGTRYLSVEYVSMPSDAVEGVGSDYASGEALQAWRREFMPIWARSGYRDPARLRYTCKLGTSTYEITSVRGVNEPNCDDGPTKLTLRSQDDTYLENLNLSPSCARGTALRSVELWEGYGGRTPQQMRICVFDNQDTALSCVDYRPHPGQFETNPPISQVDLDEFVARRKAGFGKPAKKGEFVRDARDLTRFMEIRYPCEFPNLKLPNDAVIYAVAGGRFEPLPFRIGAHPDSYQSDLIVNAPGKKVALLLLGYEQSVWNIRWTPGTDIVAVAATGSGRQAFAGIPRGVPTFSPHDGSGFACKYPEGFDFTAVQRKDRAKVDPIAMEIYRRPTDGMFVGYRQPAIAGDPLPPSAQLIQSSDTPPESFRVSRP